MLTCTRDSDNKLLWDVCIIVRLMIIIWEKFRMYMKILDIEVFKSNQFRSRRKMERDTFVNGKIRFHKFVCMNAVWIALPRRRMCFITFCTQLFLNYILWLRSLEHLCVCEKETFVVLYRRLFAKPNGCIHEDIWIDASM